MNFANWLVYCLWVGMSVVLLVLQHWMHKASDTRAIRIANGIDELRSSGTGIVSFSVGFDGLECVCVTDIWTGYAEQCFMSGTIEGALDTALQERRVFISGL